MPTYVFYRSIREYYEVVAPDLDTAGERLTALAAEAKISPQSQEELDAAKLQPKPEDISGFWFFTLLNE